MNNIKVSSTIRSGPVDINLVSSLTMHKIMEILKIGSEAFVSLQSALDFVPDILIQPDMLWLFALAFIGLVWIRRNRIKRQVTA